MVSAPKRDACSCASETSVFTFTPSQADSFSFTITDLNMGPGRLALWLPARFGRPYEVLAESEAASEVVFSGDGILLTPSEGTVSLEVTGEIFTDCRVDPRRSVWEHAKLSGVDFRATGNEPGWHLEIRSDQETDSGKRIRFVYDYGERDAVLHAPAPVSDPDLRRTEYRGENGELTIVVLIVGEACTDTMRGEPFESTVTVEFQRRSYHGCGRALH